MSIEFPCPSCKTLIRTPAGTEGQPARCPQCGSIVSVPGGDASVSTPAAVSFPTTPNSFPPPQIPLEPAAANSFAEQQTASLNPYAAPVNSYAQDPLHVLTGPELARRAHAKLILPAIGMIVFSVSGLAMMALVAMMVAIDPEVLFRDLSPDPAEQIGAIGSVAAYFGLGFLTRALQLLGAVAMLRQRGYSLALAGAICGLIPCEYVCCLPSLPFAIWALIVLNSADVKAAFSR